MTCPGPRGGCSHADAGIRTAACATQPLGHSVSERIICSPPALVDQHRMVKHSVYLQRVSHSNEKVAAPVNTLVHKRLALLAGFSQPFFGEGVIRAAGIRFPGCLNKLEAKLQMLTARADLQSAHTTDRMHPAGPASAHAQTAPRAWGFSRSMLGARKELTQWCARTLCSACCRARMCSHLRHQWGLAWCARVTALQAGAAREAVHCICSTILRPCPPLAVSTASGSFIRISEPGPSFESEPRSGLAPEKYANCPDCRLPTFR
ncbi:hypothetical protein NDU88_003783 [Pleurodeles waltl]|uniref:Uncharacterized protein n=1 Tax=Pleurodeles waltl TaxID=8319 RepID=A0AAV7UZF1_PLEWA|nr:hypothetical protein NDU88_003783 [Pleurodeles waltl]